MNRKLLFSSALVLLLVSAGLFWAKWKQDNPNPTARGLKVRQQLLSAKEAYIHRGGVEFHILSSQERAEIAHHLYVFDSSDHMFIATVSDKGKCRLDFGTPDQFSNRIHFSPEPQTSPDYFRGNRPLELRLHPATSRYLRHWAKELPRAQ